MSRIFTPSERTRRNTNPQPVNTSSSSIRRSRYLVILKNIVGAPIPLLWVLLAVSLFGGYDFHRWLSLIIACFTAIYIGIDRFSQNREFRFFRLGIEIPLALIFVFLGIANYVNHGNPISFQVLDLASWSILLYLLTYSLNLFPGLNRFFWAFTGAGFIYCGISIWQYVSGQSILWGNTAPQFLEATKTGMSMLPIPHAFVSGILVLYSLSFFVFKKRKISFLGALIGCLLLLSAGSLLISQKLILLSAFVIPSIYYSVFVSKKTLRDIIISAVLFVGAVSLAKQVPAINELLYSSSEIEQIQIEKEYWRSEFESFGEQIWLGKDTSISKIDFIKTGITENQIFLFESNYYLQMLSSQGIIHFLLMILLFLIVLFRSMSLLNDVPETHHWHKIFVFFLISTHIYLFVSFMTMIPWYSNQITSIMLCFYAISFYMGDAYTKQIVPDDRSL